MTMAGYLAYDKRLAKVAKNMVADPTLDDGIYEIVRSVEKKEKTRRLSS